MNWNRRRLRLMVEANMEFSGTSSNTYTSELLNQTSFTYPVMVGSLWTSLESSHYASSKKYNGSMTTLEFTGTNQISLLAEVFAGLSAT
ncbi:ACT domain-containing protein ACR7-like [Lycium ferocissimum]|uniref:ACT domain-containing protein ACR7-like n=1 Tax=Lycium ferocissimum TaxID=112874 RepID=UPI002814B3A9|nr:ACT domain-containing protein ACR7-like [Lycium ferocissimum]